MVAVASAKVNAQLSPDDLIHMVDISVASKYGADLTQFTHVVAEDIRNTLDTFKADLSSSFPRQVRSIVQQIGGRLKENVWKGCPRHLAQGVLLARVITECLLMLTSLTKG
jgi:hypothetical protein